MTLLRTIYTRIDRFNEWVGRITSWLTLLMVLVTFAVVMLRYLFNQGWIAMQESVTYMHAFVFMLAAAYTLKHDDHVRVDIFYRPLSARKKAWVNLLGALFLLLPVCLFILHISWEYVAASWELMEGSREAGGLDLVWLLKGIILVMPVLIALQGIAQICQSLLIVLGREEA